MEKIKIILGSNNPGKIREIKSMFEPLGIEVLSQKEAGILKNPEETGKTFEANAIIKARAIYEAVEKEEGETILVLADDSGLCITAENNYPGVETHRCLGEKATDEERNAHFIEVANKHSDRSAKFVTTIVCYDGCEILSKEEILEGKIAFEAKGKNGFGFDPVFIPLLNNQKGLTLGQMDLKTKNDKFSPRTAAVNGVYELIKEKYLKQKNENKTRKLV